MTVLNRPVGEGAAGGKLANGWHPHSYPGAGDEEPVSTTPHPLQGEHSRPIPHAR